MSFSAPPCPPRSKARRALLVTGVALAAVLAPAGAAHAAPAAGFTQVNLISDVPGLARVTDVLVANPWGVAFAPGSPLWINNNGSATSEVYSGANGHDPLTRRLVVQVPSAPTGIAFNPTPRFVAHQNGTAVPTAFLFNGLDGYTSGWGPTATPVTSAIPTDFVRSNGYLGMAVADTPAGPRLYATTTSGRVRVFDGAFHLLPTPSAFVDPHVPAGLAPYNVAVFGSQVYVTYASPADAPGGAISVFTLGGDFVRRLSTDRHLDAPWGMAMAPARWGPFGGMLLVGNEDNGRINAIDPATGAFRGQLQDTSGHPIVNRGTWGLAFGNGVTGTPRDLIFAAGIDEYVHGLVGMIRPAS